VVVIVARPVYATRREELVALGVDGDGGSDPADGIDVDLPSGQRVSVRLLDDPATAMSVLREGPVGAILLDNRVPEGPEIFSETVAGLILPELLAGAAVGRAPSRRSILVVLPQSTSTADHAYAIGSLQLGGVLVEPPDLATALDAAVRHAIPSEPGKVALCLAGGGIEGMFYELGVLRAVDAHLAGRSLIDFDIFSGISAGAVLCAFLANGVRPGEIADALHGRQSRVAPVTRTILFNPNLGEVTKRVGGALADLMRGRFLTNPIDSALKVAPTALFSGDKLRSYLEQEFNKPGLSNDFRRLRKELFIGATDQDTGAHVTFGEGDLASVPISVATRASTAMTPYYAPEKIGGRYFVDGIFTRTINLDVAVASGARLVICVDPLTPVQADEAGYVSDRGGFFNTVQSIKSMIRTRLSELIGRAEESYPDVSVFVFSPTPRDLEQMSGTLMRFFNRAETEEMAYESACQRIATEFDWHRADFERHGFVLERY
jgi:predicted acylesterase/phospholipase RssA